MADAAPWQVPSDAADIAAHNATTHNVHGIADTADLALRSRLELNAKDPPFNAKGDGSDDTAALAALAAAGGRAYLPPGTYVATNWPALPSNTHWRGAGEDTTVIKVTGAGSKKGVANADQVNGNVSISLRDMTIDRTDGADANDVYDDAGHFRYVNRFAAWGVRFRGGMKGLHLQSCSGVVAFCAFDTFRDNGIAVADASGVGMASAADQRVVVLGNDVKQTAATKAAAGSSPVIVTQAGTVVADNTIESTVALGGYGIEIANPTTNASDVQVQGNALRGCGILVGHGARHLVHDNDLQDAAVASSARIVLVPTGVGAAVSNPSVAGNKINGAAAAPNGNLRFEGVTGGNCSGNELHGGAYIFRDGATTTSFRDNSQEAANPYTSLEHIAQPGIVAPKTQLACALTTTFAPAANTAYYCRFVPEKDITVTLIAFRVTTAASVNDSCDVGILDASGAVLASSGATAGKLNALGTQTIALTAAVRLRAGQVYYAVFDMGAIGGAAVNLLGYNFVTGGASLLFAGSGANVDTGSAADVPPISAAVMANITGASQVPLLALREA